MYVYPLKSCFVNINYQKVCLVPHQLSMEWITRISLQLQNAQIYSNLKMFLNIVSIFSQYDIWPTILSVSAPLLLFHVNTNVNKYQPVMATNVMDSICFWAWSGSNLCKNIVQQLFDGTVYCSNNTVNNTVHTVSHLYNFLLLLIHELINICVSNNEPL